MRLDLRHTKCRLRSFIGVAAAALFLLYGALPAAVLLPAWAGAVTSVLFFAGLAAWYGPGLVFAWTGAFAVHEFGAAPTGWPGHLLAVLFYLVPAYLAVSLRAVRATTRFSDC